ncbi:hypothetical protein HBB16_07635, partial [Pseudonocardia sp. MCCB 268]|nr:hypothetical protein [Pseudonocardia cytotoxica]
MASTSGSGPTAPGHEHDKGRRRAEPANQLGNRLSRASRGAVDSVCSRLLALAVR